MVHEVDDALRQDADHVHRQWEEHHEKVAVVTPTYAVVQPRTVVIKCLKHNTITVTKKSMNKIQSFNFNTSSTKEPKLLFPCSLPTTSINYGMSCKPDFQIHLCLKMFASPSQRVQVNKAKEVSRSQGMTKQVQLNKHYKLSLSKVRLQSNLQHSHWENSNAKVSATPRHLSITCT